VGRSDHNNPGPGYLMTEGEYEDFRLTLDFWISQRGNSGVYVREPHQTWGHLGDQRPAHGEPRGYEIQIDFNDKKNPTGSVYGTHASSKLVGGEERWNRYEIECRGAAVAVKVDGELVTEYDGLRVQKGCIGLQVHGQRPHDHVCRFRAIEAVVL
jgi:3-keto-disaccharide hydrolase